MMRATAAARRKKMIRLEGNGRDARGRSHAEMTAKARERHITIDISEPCADWRTLRRRRAICSAAALAALAAGPAASGDIELSIVLGDDALSRRLNRQWRGKDRPTNVLSFPAQDGAAISQQAGAPLPLGDVVLAFGTIAGEAAAQGKTLQDHLAHLVVHGVLHLLGLDHEEAAEAERMEALETTILAGLGVADPYAAEAPRAAHHG
jgi:probable rRNA maturation factor